MTLAQWSEVISVNLTSAFLLSRAALPRLIERGAGGRVIFISSISGPEVSVLIWLNVCCC